VQKINAAKNELEGAKGALEKAGAEWEYEARVLQEALKELGIQGDDGVSADENALAEVKKMDEAAEAAGNRLKQLRVELERCVKNIEEARRVESEANVTRCRLFVQEYLVMVSRFLAHGFLGSVPVVFFDDSTLL